MGERRARFSDRLIRTFREEGVDHVFLVPGALIDPMYPALTGTEGVRPIVAAHEAGAAFMADGYARASRRFGVTMCIGGPGVLNQLTAAATARTDFSPVLYLSGSVATDFEGRGGFQDASPVALRDVDVLRPVTVASIQVESPLLLEHHLRSAMTKMLAPPKGPVHLSLPEDLESAEVRDSWTPLASSLYTPRFADPIAIEQMLDLLAGGSDGERPGNVVVYAGAGVEHSEATQELVEFAERFETPVATTLRAKGVFPEDHPLSLGVFGYAGHRHAIEVILSEEVEVLIVLGSGLNQRDTLHWSKRMLPSRALIHVDIDPQVPGRTFPTDIPAVGDVRSVLRGLLEAAPDQASRLEQGREHRRHFIGRIRDTGARYCDAEFRSSDEVPIHPARLVTELRRAMPRETILLVDSGAHRAFCAQFWDAYEPLTYISATNIGPMGWAIPAGIGVKCARPDRPVVVVTGDGCMRMHGIEIQAAARYGIPVIVVVLNNDSLGNVNLRARAQGAGPDELTSLPDHDWSGFARALGADGVRVERPDELAAAFADALEAERGFVVDARTVNVPTPVAPYTEAKREWSDDA